MRALGPSDLHVKRDLSKYVNAGVKQAQRRGREVPCYRPPVVFGEKAKKEVGRRFMGQADCVIFTTCQAVCGPGLEEQEPPVCITHQQHQHPTGISNIGLSNHAIKEHLYNMPTTQIFRLPSHRLLYDKKKQKILLTDIMALTFIKIVAN